MKELGVMWRVSFSSFSLQQSEPAWLLWWDPTPSQMCPALILSRRIALPMRRVPPWAALSHLWGYLGALPNQCADCRSWTAPRPLLIPLWYIAYSVYRVAAVPRCVLLDALPFQCAGRRSRQRPSHRWDCSGALPYQCPACRAAPIAFAFTTPMHCLLNVLGCRLLAPEPASIPCLRFRLARCDVDQVSLFVNSCEFQTSPWEGGVSDIAR